jgi:hypothetical protein
MKRSIRSCGIDRRALLSGLALVPALSSAPLFPASAQAQTAPSGEPLASWNDGPAKQAILDFVRTTTDRASPNFVPPEERIAVFDQDGTLWVEHPLRGAVLSCPKGQYRGGGELDQGQPHAHSGGAGPRASAGK